MANKWMTRLAKHDSNAKKEKNPFSSVLRFSSPYMNFLFGNTHGLPLGAKIQIYGPNKGGKSTLAYDMIGQLHKSDPEAIAIRYDTEYRNNLQLTPAMQQIWGIDDDRYQPYKTNEPEKIFDHIVNEVRAMCQEGAPIKLIVIDSIANITGRRTMNAEGIMTQQMGDEAATIQAGLKMILSTINDYKIGLVLINQVRSEMDPQKAKYNPFKPWGAWFLKHFAEYEMLVQPVMGKEAQQSLTGQDLSDGSKKAGLDGVLAKPEQRGHRIRATMKNSSIGPKNRSAEITLEYAKGFVNQHEEIFQLGVGRGVIERPNNRTYVVKDFPEKGKQWEQTGFDATVSAFKNNENLCNYVLGKVREQDVDIMEKQAGSAYYAMDDNTLEESSEE